MYKDRIENVKKGMTFAFYPNGVLYETLDFFTAYGTCLIIARRHGSKVKSIAHKDIRLCNPSKRVYVYD